MTQIDPKNTRRKYAVMGRRGVLRKTSTCAKYALNMLDVHFWAKNVKYVLRIFPPPPAFGHSWPTPPQEGVWSQQPVNHSEKPRQSPGVERADTLSNHVAWNRPPWQVGEWSRPPQGRGEHPTPEAVTPPEGRQSLLKKHLGRGSDGKTWGGHQA